MKEWSAMDVEEWVISGDIVQTTPATTVGSINQDTWPPTACVNSGDSLNSFFELESQIQ